MESETDKFSELEGSLGSVWFNPHPPHFLDENICSPEIGNDFPKVTVAT